MTSKRFAVFLPTTSHTNVLTNQSRQKRYTLWIRKKQKLRKYYCPHLQKHEELKSLLKYSSLNITLKKPVYFHHQVFPIFLDKVFCWEWNSISGPQRCICLLSSRGCNSNIVLENLWISKKQATSAWSRFPNGSRS